MSTRSAIGISYQGVIKAVYVHSDGYMDYVGTVLNEHYQDTVKISKLISMGDMSMLGKEIGRKIDFNARMAYDENDQAEQCRFYDRDRGETGVEHSTYHSESAYVRGMADRDCEFMYLYKDGEWFVTTGTTFFPLTPLLMKEAV